MTRTEAIKALMRSAQQDIEQGQRKGARIVFPKAHPKIHIGWFKRRILRGEFKGRKAR